MGFSLFKSLRQIHSADELGCACRPHIPAPPPSIPSRLLPPPTSPSSLPHPPPFPLPLLLALSLALRLPAHQPAADVLDMFSGSGSKAAECQQNAPQTSPAVPPVQPAGRLASQAVGKRDVSASGGQHSTDGVGSRRGYSSDGRHPNHLKRQAVPPLPPSLSKEGEEKKEPIFFSSVGVGGGEQRHNVARLPKGFQV